MSFWIEHPACDNPVSFWRWLLFKMGARLNHVAYRLQMVSIRWMGIAVYGEHADDEIPF